MDSANIEALAKEASACLLYPSARKLIIELKVCRSALIEFHMNAPNLMIKDIAY